MLGLEAYLQYFNKTDATVIKGIEILEKGEAFPKAPVDELLAQGRTVFLKIEVQGAEKIRKLYPEAVSIFPVSYTHLHKIRQSVFGGLSFNGLYMLEYEGQKI